MSSSPSQNHEEHRRPLDILFSIFSGVLVGLFLSQLKAPIHNADYAEEQERSSSQQCEGSANLPQVSAGLQMPTMEPPQPPVHHYDSNDERRDRFNRGVFWVQLITLIALGVYAAFTYGILCETRKSAEVAHDTLVKLNRPWLGVKDTATTSGAVVIQPTSRNFTQINASVSLTIRNFGSSPALHVSVAPMVLSAQPIEVFDRVAKTAETTCQAADAMSQTTPIKGQEGIGFAIFPNDEGPYNMPAGTVATLNPAIDAHLTIIGCIAYRDQFKEVMHHTTFCLASDTPMSAMKNSEPLHACTAVQNAD
jgi:hypothetical protein